MREKSGRKPGQKSHLWVTGPDPIIHGYFRVFLQHRNQANFRNEDYELSFEQWLSIWGDKIEQRGRKTGQYQMIRIDKDSAWTIDNIMIKEKVKYEHHKTKSTKTID